MPLYLYRCRECGKRFEKLVSIAERENVKCESCGGGVERVYEGSCAFGKKAGGGCSGKSCACCSGCKH